MEVVDENQNKKLDDLADAVKSLTFDNERIVKPALKDIREILSRDIYTTKNETAELKAEITELKACIKELEKKVQNYTLVERLVFGLVALFLVAVVGALVSLVIYKRG